MKKPISLLLLPGILVVCLFVGCDKSADVLPGEPTHRYLFLGHTYSWKDGEGRVDRRIHQLDLAAYDEIWLGGDLLAATTADRSYLDYLDALFNLDHPGTLWALGNHDLGRGHVDWITEATGRPTFYSTYRNGLTTVVINTLLNRPVYEDSCALKAQQMEMIRTVCDTIRESSHLVFLMHTVTWGWVEKGMNTHPRANAHFPWWAALCQSDSRFHDVVYPLLKEVQARGINVMVISGDGGQRAKQYAYRTKEGVQFFISGINNSLEYRPDLPEPYSEFNFNPDSVLILEHSLESQNLAWSFHQLNELIEP